MRSARLSTALATVVVLAGACSSSSPTVSRPKRSAPPSRTATTVATLPPAGEGIHKIRHVIVIMQENRSFDSYFGTFPGADGLPAAHGQFTVCVPNPATNGCDRPFHDPADVNGGADHTHTAAIGDVDNGKMDGFIARAESVTRVCNKNAVLQNPVCAHSNHPDVMGYHDAREIPNYWTYAKHFTLSDHMFEPVASWSLPDHLYMVSAWSALCATSSPSSCHNNIDGPFSVRAQDLLVRRALSSGTAPLDDAWTDVTYLLYKHRVSWAYYVENGSEPDCIDSSAVCPRRAQTYRTPGIWNPLPLFTDVHADHQLGNIQPVQRFIAAARSGTLPAVSWVTPSQPNSEHPPASVHEGQAWVTNLINSVMRGPDWATTAIFVSWDDWGGFYDHMVPPKVDGNGYGLRVPMILISPYARRGYIDHQVLSHDAFLKFIEDDFLGGARLDPKTDGRPDPRPDVRESASQLGDLARDFDFAQSPRAPLILPLAPRPGPASHPAGS